MSFNELSESVGLVNDIAVIEQFRADRLPVVMYGATVDVADQIVKKMSANGIEIDKIIFDDDTPVMAEKTVYLKETERIHVRDIDSVLPAYNVVAGYVKAYSNVESIAAKLKNVRSVEYLSEIFDMEEISQSFVLENLKCLKDLYDGFLDQHSKDSFVAYLMSKTRQDMKYLPSIFEKTQYFPKGLFELSAKDSYFDCGAFTGDTIADFLKASGGAYKHIWAAEPDCSNYNKLMQYIESENLTDIDVVNKGIYGFAGKLPFQEEGSMLSMINEASEHFIEVDTIDNITAGKPVTYIKMDVEGAELMALKGAAETIRKYKPILGISIYHKERDLIDIPAFIKELVPEYKFYFRVHKKLAIDTVLYAIVL